MDDRRGTWCVGVNEGGKDFKEDLGGEVRRMVGERVPVHGGREGCWEEGMGGEYDQCRY